MHRHQSQKTTGKRARRVVSSSPSHQRSITTSSTLQTLSAASSHARVMASASHHGSDGAYTQQMRRGITSSSRVSPKATTGTSSVVTRRRLLDHDHHDQQQQHLHQHVATFSTASSSSTIHPPTINENLLNASPASLKQSVVQRPTDKLRNLIDIIVPDDQVVDDYTYLRIKKMTVDNPDLLSISRTKLESRFQDLSKLVLHPSFYREYTKRYVFVGGNKPTREFGLQPPKHSVLPLSVIKTIDEFKRISADLKSLQDELAIKQADVDKATAKVKHSGGDNTPESSDKSTFAGIGDDIDTIKKNIEESKKLQQQRQDEYNAALQYKQSYDTVHQKPFHPLVLSVLDRHPSILRRKNLHLTPNKIMELFKLNKFDIRNEFQSKASQDVVDDLDHEEKTTSRGKQHNDRGQTNGDGLNDTAVDPLSGELDPHAILGRYPALLTLDIENRLQQKVASLNEYLGDKQLTMRLIMAQPDILHANVDAIVPKRLSFLSNACLLSPDEAIEFVRYFPRVLSPSITNSQLQRLTTFRLSPPQFHHITDDQIVALGYEASFAKDMINKLSSFTEDQFTTTHDDEATTVSSQGSTRFQSISPTTKTKCWAESFIDPEEEDNQTIDRAIQQLPLINPRVSLALNHRFAAMKYVILMHNMTFNLLFSEYSLARKRFLLGTSNTRLVKSEEIIPHYDRLMDRKARQGTGGSDDDDEFGSQQLSLSKELHEKQSTERRVQEEQRIHNFQQDAQRNRFQKSVLRGAAGSATSSSILDDDNSDADKEIRSKHRSSSRASGDDSDEYDLLTGDDLDPSDLSDNTRRSIYGIGSDADEYAPHLNVSEDEMTAEGKIGRNPGDKVHATRTFKQMQFDDRHDDGMNDANRRVLQRDQARRRRHLARGQYRLVEQNIAEKDLSHAGDDGSSYDSGARRHAIDKGHMYDRLKLVYSRPDQLYDDSPIFESDNDDYSPSDPEERAPPTAKKGGAKRHGASRRTPPPKSPFEVKWYGDTRNSRRSPKM